MRPDSAMSGPQSSERGAVNGGASRDSAAGPSRPSRGLGGVLDTVDGGAFSPGDSVPLQNVVVAEKNDGEGEDEADKELRTLPSRIRTPTGPPGPPQGSPWAAGRPPLPPVEPQRPLPSPPPTQEDPLLHPRGSSGSHALPPGLTPGSAYASADVQEPPPAS